jgi:tetratricopeptide (TPR) repeat protein
MESKAHKHYRRGNELRACGCDADALHEYEEAIRLKPDFLIAKKCADFLRSHLEKKFLSFGRLYETEGNLKDAYEEYRRALKINPESSQAHKHIGLLSLEMGNLSRANRHIRRALALNPSYGILYFYLAQIYDREEKYAEAISSPI